MITHRKSRGLHLRKTNDRWIWMASATAVTAAAATSQAGTITVTYTNNFIDAFAGNHLYGSLLKDGVPIISFGAPQYHLSNFSGAGDVLADIQGLKGNTSSFKPASASFDGDYAFAKAGSKSTRNSSSQEAKVEATVPIKFMDPNVNGGALTQGTLFFNAAAQGFGEGGFATITLEKFTYPMMSAGVPEGGSTLALLVLGAGGVIALRRFRQAA